MKFKVTNTSPSSKKGAHAIFFTEVGRLLKPGQQLLTNRLDEDKFQKRDNGFLSIEEGNWAKVGVTAAQAATPVKASEETVESKDEDSSELATESTESMESVESKDEDTSEPPAESTESEAAPELPSEEETVQTVDVSETQPVEDERVEESKPVATKESKSKSRRRGKNKNREED